MNAVREGARRLPLLLLAVLVLAPAARADGPPPGVERITYRYGPVEITPGQNSIYLTPNVEKPTRNGFITRFKPDLVRADGSVPRVDVIHLHHGVWLNASRSDATYGGPDRFFASGEEKTIFRLPPGYGYPHRASDTWLMNHMIHNLTTGNDRVWITYEVDFVPADSELARTMKPARPIWMDVQNGSAYPVFDVLRGSGGDRTFTYPDEAVKPYANGPRRNVWTVDRDGTLLGSAGHVHPGGLRTDTFLERDGAKTLDHDAHDALHRDLDAEHAAAHRKLYRSRSYRRGNRRKRTRLHRALHGRRAASHDRRHAALTRDSALIARSEAKYYDPNGPISWDMSMTATKPGWRVAVKKGDKLRINATYETERASWYESMGIVVLWMADDASGKDPFAERVDPYGEVTHGHLPENDNHGGRTTGLPDPTTLPDGQTLDRRVGIANFTYMPGDLSLSGSFRNPPIVRAGETVRFENLDSPESIYHSVTTCRPPCNRSTGISYPLADGDPDLDSGELGYGPPALTPAAQRSSWQTPSDLKPGTYTYFCRIHPSMRGAFRVKE